VGDHDSVKAALAKAEAALGPVTILVNNAGNAGPIGGLEDCIDPVFWETAPSGWDRFLRTNLFGVMNCCHLAVPSMIKQGKGRIVTVVSDAGRVGEARLAVYAAAKAGAAGFMRSLAKEVGRYGVTANSIALGTLEPPMTEEQKAAWLASDRAKAVLSRYVIRRRGLPDDVANLALFLCSDAASWITGQTPPLNGGYSLNQ
jgi:3-oxoacyl-[acyl-carrier protein] reductase